MRKQGLLSLAFATLLLAGAAQARAVPADPRLAAIRSEILSSVESGRLPSVSVGAIENGRTIWAESFGFADRERRVPATGRTRYALASLGKSITATAVMTLVRAGAFRLEDPVSAVLGRGALRNRVCDREPRIRELLDMSAGVPHGAATYRTGEPLSEADLIGVRSFVAFCPGTVFYYSNYSIAIADRLIERASGTGFGAYLARRVFAPLGMRQSGVGTPAGLAEPAVRYSADGRAIGAIQPFPRSSRAIYSSLEDLLAYATFNLGRRRSGQRAILDRSELALMHSSGSGLPGATTALGWGRVEIGGSRRLIIANGNDMGAQSALFLVPESGVAIVLLSNGSGFQLDELAVRAADALSPGIEAAFARLRDDYEHSAGVPSDPAWLGTWDGIVDTPRGPVPLIIRFAPDGSGSASLGDGGAFPVTGASLAFGLLRAQTRGRLELEESPAETHRIRLALRREGASATGFLTATFANPRGEFELPAAVRLQRRPANSQARSIRFARAVMLHL